MGCKASEDLSSAHFPSLVHLIMSKAKPCFIHSCRRGHWAGRAPEERPIACVELSFCDP